jgi:hypothetical protein
MAKKKEQRKSQFDDVYTKGKYVIIIEGEQEKEYNKVAEVDNTRKYYEDALKAVETLTARLKKETDKGMIANIKNTIQCKLFNIEQFKKKLGITEEEK